MRVSALVLSLLVIGTGFAAFEYDELMVSGGRADGFCYSDYSGQGVTVGTVDPDDDVDCCMNDLHLWLRGGSGADAPCCGDDGASDDWAATNFYCCDGGIQRDLDESAACREVCNDLYPDGGWRDGACCGDDENSDDYIGSNGVCLDGEWISGGDCLTTSDCYNNGNCDSYGDSQTCVEYQETTRCLVPNPEGGCFFYGFDCVKYAKYCCDGVNNLEWSCNNNVCESEDKGCSTICTECCGNNDCLESMNYGPSYRVCDYWTDGQAHNLNDFAGKDACFGGWNDPGAYYSGTRLTDGTCSDGCAFCGFFCEQEWNPGKCVSNECTVPVDIACTTDSDYVKNSGQINERVQCEQYPDTTASETCVTKSVVLDSSEGGYIEPKWCVSYYGNKYPCVGAGPYYNWGSDIQQYNCHDEYEKVDCNCRTVCDDSCDKTCVFESDCSSGYDCTYVDWFTQKCRKIVCDNKQCSNNNDCNTGGGYYCNPSTNLCTKATRWWEVRDCRDIIIYKNADVIIDQKLTQLFGWRGVSKSEYDKAIANGINYPAVTEFPS